MRGLRSRGARATRHLYRCAEGLVTQAFVPFLYELRARKVKVGAQEAIALAQALARGCTTARSTASITWRARSASTASRTSTPSTRRSRPTSAASKPRASRSARSSRTGSSDPKKRRDLTPRSARALESIDLEELRRLFEERLREQKERHDGGNRWIGTGGTSPFGRQRNAPERHARGRARRRAQRDGVADARRYRPYRSDVVLDVRQIEVALRKLRAFAARARPRARPRRDDRQDREERRRARDRDAPAAPAERARAAADGRRRIDGPARELVSRLFSRREARVEHPRAQDVLLPQLHLRPPLRDRALQRSRSASATCSIRAGAEYKLVVVGDAAMHPAELLGAGDWDYYSPATRREEAGVRWMTLLDDHFRSVWLNPDEPHYWRGGTAETLRASFRMYPLTLEGLEEAVRHLSGAQKSRG